MASINWDVAIVSLLQQSLPRLQVKDDPHFPALHWSGVGYIYAMVRGLVDFGTIADAHGVCPSAIRNAGIHMGRHLGMAPIALVTIIEDLGHMFV